MDVDLLHIPPPSPSLNFTSCNSHALKSKSKQGFFFPYLNLYTSYCYAVELSCHISTILPLLCEYTIFKICLCSPMPQTYRLYRMLDVQNRNKISELSLREFSAIGLQRDGTQVTSSSLSTHTVLSCFLLSLRSQRMLFDYHVRSPRALQNLTSRIASLPRVTHFCHNYDLPDCPPYLSLVSTIVVYSQTLQWDWILNFSVDI